MLAMGHRHLAPDPAQRLREDGAAVLHVVRASTELAPVVVPARPQRLGHIVIGDGPLAEGAIEIALPAYFS